MTTVAYLANQFPSPTEPYVGTEIQELRLRGVKVIAGSVRSPDVESMRENSCSKDEILSLQPIRWVIAFKALCLTFMRWGRVSRFLRRALLQGNEPPKQRLGSLLHTWLGAYYAVLLRHREVNHIHVHHGYFGSWIAMVAASLLEVDFSLTLHGSDLLVHAAYLDIKLNNCKFCITISEYNRRYILNRFPALDSGKVIVSRLGVEAVRDPAFSGLIHRRTKNRFFLLGTGRLHAVKNHAFLVQACAHLRSQGLDLKCAIAGAGPERETPTNPDRTKSIDRLCKAPRTCFPFGYGFALSKRGFVRAYQYQRGNPVGADGSDGPWDTRSRSRNHWDSRAGHSRHNRFPLYAGRFR